jgi:enoyl-CoA hydratase/carnithine racemase
MVDAETALRLGIVDELVDVDQVANRAREWVEALLALPRAPMLATRKLARADMAAALDAFGDRELDAFLAQWKDPDTQAALQAVVARLRK